MADTVVPMTPMLVLGGLIARGWLRPLLIRCIGAALAIFTHRGVWSSTTVAS